MQLRCFWISAACMSSFYARTNLIQQSGHGNGIQNSWALPTICPICSTILQKPLNPFLFFFSSWLPEIGPDPITRKANVKFPVHFNGAHGLIGLYTSIFRHLNIEMPWFQRLLSPQLSLISEGGSEEQISGSKCSSVADYCRLGR